jgi:CcmD family protein
MRLDVAPPSPSTPPSAKGNETPSDRSTTFQAVEGGEVHNGTVLVVEAYAFIWLALLGFVFLQWKKQATLHARIDDLERVVDRAAAKLESQSVGKKSKAAEDRDDVAPAAAAAKEA